MRSSQLFQTPNDLASALDSYRSAERKDTPPFGEIEPPERKATPPIFASDNVFSFRGFDPGFLSDFIEPG